MKKSHNKLIIIIGAIILLVIIAGIYYSTDKTAIKENNFPTNQDSNTQKTITNPAPSNPPIIKQPEVETSKEVINTTNSTPTETTQDIKIFLGTTTITKIKGYDQNITVTELSSATTASIKIDTITRIVNKGSTYGISYLNANIQIKEVYYDANNKENSYIIITVL